MGARCIYYRREDPAARAGSGRDHYQMILSSEGMMNDAFECGPDGHGGDGVHKLVEDDVTVNAVMCCKGARRRLIHTCLSFMEGTTISTLDWLASRAQHRRAPPRWSICTNRSIAVCHARILTALTNGRRPTSLMAQGTKAGSQTSPALVA